MSTWKGLTDTTLSPIMEFTVDDFPTPPFPITSIVNVLTFCRKISKVNDSLEIVKNQCKGLNGKISLRYGFCDHNMWIKMNITSCFSFPINSSNFACVAIAKLLIPTHSRITWDAMKLCVPVIKFHETEYKYLH